MPAKTKKTSLSGGEVNPDPITGEPGSHPIGTGVGAASGGAAGASIGAVGGPIGAAVGAVVGAVAGAYAGHGVAEVVDPTAEDAYWREQHRLQPYARDDRPYEDYAPAYRTGYVGYREGQTFEQREAELRAEYEGGRKGSDQDFTHGDEVEAARQPGTMQHSMSTYALSWEGARDAVRAAYDRVDRARAARKSETGTVPKEEPIIPQPLV
jgi:hypothetical protein